MSLQRVAVPNGVEQKVGADELFFSTTDRQGRIRSGNSVFARISQFSIEELVGSPHNIVRHPEMPAGVFRLIWDRLYADRPVGTYVKNLARDGSSYWVFATVTPLGTDGYLSVRMAPRTPLFTTVQRIYEYVLEAEREAAERDGLNRREVARLGKERLEEMLRRLGFHSHDEFLAEALSGEVAARGRMASGTYARPWAEGAIAEVLSSSGALEEILASLLL
ncbi:MAG: PAS domain S-box protein, partial [Thermobispora sp.]|nr:PAS domain S-box protein [Thermobispora sp.]